jgi:hypothetical protein
VESGLQKEREMGTNKTRKRERENKNKTLGDEDLKT